MPYRGTAPYAHQPVLPLRSLGVGGGSRVECVAAEELARHAAELEGLRLRSLAAGEIISMPAWLAARHTPPGWVPRTLLLRSGARLEAAVFLLERTVLGLPTGYFRGGDALGETLILCDAGREEEFLARTLKLFLDSHRAFLVLLDQPPETVAPSPNGFRRRSVAVTLHWQHQLAGSFDATVASFGHRTRRNLRYALRRVEKNGWQFLPNLSARQLIAAVSHLSTRSTHPFPPEIVATRLNLAARTPDSFAMGLVDAQGQWLSCLIGRRTGSTTEIFWQANAAGHAADSLCTTMRSLFMREEVRLNAASVALEKARMVRYIGGTCPFMQHCCTPSESLQTSLARRGLRWLLATALAKAGLLSAAHPLRNHL